MDFLCNDVCNARLMVEEKAELNGVLIAVLPTFSASQREAINDTR